MQPYQFELTLRENSRAHVAFKVALAIERISLLSGLITLS